MKEYRAKMYSMSMNIWVIQEKRKFLCFSWWVDIEIASGEKEALEFLERFRNGSGDKILS